MKQCPYNRAVKCAQDEPCQGCIEYIRGNDELTPEDWKNLGEALECGKEKGMKDKYPFTDVMDGVLAELTYAMGEYAPMHSPHEGWAVIKEEMDELWEYVRQWPKHDPEAMRKEAKQVAAMAIRFMLDVT